MGVSIENSLTTGGNGEVDKPRAYVNKVSDLSEDSELSERSAQRFFLASSAIGGEDSAAAVWDAPLAAWRAPLAPPRRPAAARPAPERSPGSASAILRRTVHCSHSARTIRRSDVASRNDPFPHCRRAARRAQNKLCGQFVDLGARSRSRSAFTRE